MISHPPKNLFPSPGSVLWWQICWDHVFCLLLQQEILFHNDYALFFFFRTASFSQHTCDEHQCLHQSVVLHRPLPHTFHGQHTKEVRSDFALLTLMWEVLVSLKALVWSLLGMVTTRTGLLCINLGIGFHTIVCRKLPKAVPWLV